jgi:hypothetical protein
VKDGGRREKQVIKRKRDNYETTKKDERRKS